MCHLVIIATAAYMKRERRDIVDKFGSDLEWFYGLMRLLNDGKHYTAQTIRFPDEWAIQMLNV